MPSEILPPDYNQLLQTLKSRIQTASFAEAWPNEEFVRQAVAQIPWDHNVRLLDKTKDAKERAWYVEQTIAYGWSRAILEHQIETQLYQRQGKATSNFEATYFPIPARTPRSPAQSLAQH